MNLISLQTLPLSDVDPKGAIRSELQSQVSWTFQKKKLFVRFREYLFYLICKIFRPFMLFCGKNTERSSVKSALKDSVEGSSIRQICTFQVLSEYSKDGFLEETLYSRAICTYFLLLYKSYVCYFFIFFKMFSTLSLFKLLL